MKITDKILKRILKESIQEISYINQEPMPTKAPADVRFQSVLTHIAQAKQEMLAAIKDSDFTLHGQDVRDSIQREVEKKFDILEDLIRRTKEQAK